MRTRIVIVLAALAAGTLPAAPARALPKYAQKEHKPCAYCHVKPAGGGARNAAGIWYAKHGHSLRGFTAAKAAPNKKNQTKTNKPKR